MIMIIIMMMMIIIMMIIIIIIMITINLLALLLEEVEEILARYDIEVRGNFIEKQQFAFTGLPGFRVGRKA